MTTPDRFREIERLFHLALELATDERDAFLERECAGDAELRDKVDRLLAHDAGGVEPRMFDAGSAAAGVPRAPLVAGARVGRYTVTRKIGEGGMGVVYEAAQTEPTRTVALKILRGIGLVDDQQERRFRREVETLAHLEHPGVAAIYESGRTEDGRPFFAMELVPGDTLRDYLGRRRGAVTRDELVLRLRLFRKIADIVQYAHQRGVIHRDLKPSNIVVIDSSGDGATSASRDSVPEIKVLDFGLARITDADVAAATTVTDVGVIQGTLPYMSPEQARGKPEEIDTRTDVYALGVLLYEMLTGSLPHRLDDVSLIEAVRVICETAPTSIRQAWSGTARLDPDIETIVGQALEKDPDRRYSSAAALADDVTRYLDSRPILARPPSAVYQLRKFAGRNRVLVGGVAATLLALAAGVVVSTSLGLREAAQRRAAERAGEDLEAVVRFQADMLAGVDAAEMGERLVEDLRRRIAEGWRERGIGDGEIEAVIGSLDESMEVVNATDAALAIVDREILERAGRTIEETFADRPEVAGRLRHTIGTTYKELGLFSRAEEQLLRAVELRRSVLGDDAPETLRSRGALASVYWRQERHDEAEPIYRDVLDRQRAILGAEHHDTLSTINNLANLLWRRGHLEESEALHRKSLAGRRRASGDDHPSTLNALHNLAMLIDERGRFDEAEPLYREALEAQRRALGDEDRITFRTIHNLGTLYLKQGRFEESERLLIPLLETRRRVLGGDHRATLATQNNLAAGFTRQGRYAEAEPLALKTLDTLRRVQGPEHPETLNAVMTLARIYANQERYDDAERMFADTLDARRRLLGERHPETLVAKISLAGLYWSVGRDAEAEPLARTAMDAMREVLGSDHPKTLRAATGLAANYRDRKRFAEAETLLIETHDDVAGLLGDDHARTRRVAAELAKLYEAWDRPKDAARWN